MGSREAAKRNGGMKGKKRKRSVDEEGRSSKGDRRSRSEKPASPKKGIAHGFRRRR